MHRHGRGAVWRRCAIEASSGGGRGAPPGRAQVVAHHRSGQSSTLNGLSRRTFLQHILATLLAVTLAPNAPVASAETQAQVPSTASSGQRPPARHAVATLPQNLASTYQEAERLARNNKYDEALPLYSTVIQQAPDYALAYGNRGNVYVALGQYAEALNDYNQAIALTEAPSAPRDRDLWVTYWNRGAVHRQLQHPSDAIRDYNRAIELRPGEPLLWVNRAVVYLEQRDYAAALRDYQHAVEQRGGQVEPFWLDYALVLYQCGRAPDAVGILRRMAVSRSLGNSDDVKAALAVVLHAFGATADAETVWSGVQRPRQYQNLDFLRSERHWPPRALEAAAQFHHLETGSATASR